MADDNAAWGAPRIHGELLKLGFDVSEPTVSRYMPRRRKPPSQTWRTFLLNHSKDLVSIDFFVVPTVTFRLLYVFVVLEHERRRIVHINVTDGPSARWTGQQIVNAFPYDSAPKYMIRDRDNIYGADFVRKVRALHNGAWRPGVAHRYRRRCGSDEGQENASRSPVSAALLRARALTLDHPMGQPSDGCEIVREDSPFRHGGT